MSSPRILLVDDQRDILRLIHATLDTLGHPFEIFEAPSGEEALLEASRHRFDLLVSDYKLPGMNGVELMKKVRAKNPDVKSILITAMTDKKTREEMIAAGAIAIFDKPIPLADFLDVVERSLGLQRTILPPEDEKVEANRESIADLLSSLRKQVNADAVYLLSDRGRVLERAGDLYDSSTEVSLLSAVMAIFSSGQKVSRLIHQEGFEHYHIFHGGDNDLVLIPVDALYALLVAGENITGSERVMNVVTAMLSARATLDRSLRLLGMPTAPAETSLLDSMPVPATTNVLTQDIENLFTQKTSTVQAADADAFWDEAVEKHGNPPLHPDVISYEQAQQLGLTPPPGTNPLKSKK